jgi:peptidoglycan/LPS O-acetylase OafA/YrhL
MNEFSKRIPELDGIRGAAILLIFITHWIGLEGGSIRMPHQLRGLIMFGASGVDLFFVLSGFLIGGILLDAKDSENYFKVFYVRRFYRILPLYGVLCLWSVAVFHAPLSTHDWLFAGGAPWYAYLTFGQNFWMAKLNSMNSSQLDATWSLAIEEQFYLVMPLVIRVVSRKLLPYVLCVGVLLAPLFRIALWFGLNPARRAMATYVLTPCRMDALLLGVLAALAVRNSICWDWLVANKRTLSAASITLGCGLLVFNRKLGFGSFGCASVGFTWIALFYLSLLLLAVTQRGIVSRLFRLRPLTELGILAYGLYLFHGPMLGLVYGLSGRASPKLIGLSTIGLTSLSAILVLSFARISWLYFEKPLVALGHRHQYRHSSVSECSTALLAQPLPNQ